MYLWWQTRILNLRPNITYAFHAHLVLFLDSPGLCLLHHPSLLCMRQPAGLIRERTSLFLSGSLLLVAHRNGASAAWAQSAQCQPPGSGPSLPTQESQEAGVQRGFTAGVTTKTGSWKWTTEWTNTSTVSHGLISSRGRGLCVFFLFKGYHSFTHTPPRQHPEQVFQSFYFKPATGWAAAAAAVWRRV